MLCLPLHLASYQSTIYFYHTSQCSTLAYNNFILDCNVFTDYVFCTLLYKEMFHIYFILTIHSIVTITIRYILYALTMHTLFSSGRHDYHILPYIYGTICYYTAFKGSKCRFLHVTFSSLEAKPLRKLTFHHKDKILLSSRRP